MFFARKTPDDHFYTPALYLDIVKNKHERPLYSFRTWRQEIMDVEPIVEAVLPTAFEALEKLLGQIKNPNGTALRLDIEVVNFGPWQLHTERRIYLNEVGVGAPSSLDGDLDDPIVGSNSVTPVPESARDKTALVIFTGQADRMCGVVVFRVGDKDAQFAIGWHLVVNDPAQCYNVLLRDDSALYLGDKSTHPGYINNKQLETLVRLSTGDLGDYGGPAWPKALQGIPGMSGNLLHAVPAGRYTFGPNSSDTFTKSATLRNEHGNWGVASHMFQVSANRFLLRTAVYSQWSDADAQGFNLQPKL